MHLVSRRRGLKLQNEREIRVQEISPDSDTRTTRKERERVREIEGAVFQAYRLPGARPRPSAMPEFVLPCM